MALLSRRSSSPANRGLRTLAHHKTECVTRTSNPQSQITEDRKSFPRDSPYSGEESCSESLGTDPATLLGFHGAQELCHALGVPADTSDTGGLGSAFGLHVTSFSCDYILGNANVPF